LGGQTGLVIALLLLLGAALQTLQVLLKNRDGQGGQFGFQRLLIGQLLLALQAQLSPLLLALLLCLLALWVSPLLFQAIGFGLGLLKTGLSAGNSFAGIMPVAFQRTVLLLGHGGGLGDTAQFRGLDGLALRALRGDALLSRLNQTLQVCFALRGQRFHGVA